MQSFRLAAGRTLASVEPALRERAEHTRRSYLQQKVRGPRVSKEDDLARTLREVREAVATLTVTNRLARATDDQLAALAEKAAITGDVPVLLAAQEEA